MTLWLQLALTACVLWCVSGAIAVGMHFFDASVTVTHRASRFAVALTIAGGVLLIVAALGKVWVR